LDLVIDFVRQLGIGVFLNHGRTVITIPDSTAVIAVIKIPAPTAVIAVITLTAPTAVIAVITGATPLKIATPPPAAVVTILIASIIVAHTGQPAQMLFFFKADR
jgi:hypothetical protein